MESVSGMAGGIEVACVNFRPREGTGCLCFWPLECPRNIGVLDLTCFLHEGQ